MNEYTEEQKALLTAALAEAKAEAAASKGWLRLVKSTAIVQRGEQTFAVFGNGRRGIARDVTGWDDDESTGTVGIVDGHAWEQVPDEGQCGVLMLVLDKHRNRWIACWPPLRWLWASELNLTDAEIAERIVGEIEAGANVLTTPPPGWA